MVLISLPFCNACFALSIATTWRISPAFQSDLQCESQSFGQFEKVSDVWFPLALFGVGRTLYSHFVKSHAFLVLTFMLLFYTSDAESTLWTILFMNTHKDQHYLPLTRRCLSFFWNILAWPVSFTYIEIWNKNAARTLLVFFWTYFSEWIISSSSSHGSQIELVHEGNTVSWHNLTVKWCLHLTNTLQSIHLDFNDLR